MNPDAPNTSNSFSAIWNKVTFHLLMDWVAQSIKHHDYTWSSWIASSQSEENIHEDFEHFTNFTGKWRPSCYWLNRNQTGRSFCSLAEILLKGQHPYYDQINTLIMTRLTPFLWPDQIHLIINQISILIMARSTPLTKTRLTPLLWPD